MKRALRLAAAAFALSACGEKPQAMKDNAKQDTAAFQGTGMPFTAPGWKPGDQASWQQQMQQRAMSQNEYVRAPAAAR